jgi:hypothetical protein
MDGVSTLLTSIDPHRALKNAGVYLESAWR